MGKMRYLALGALALSASVAAMTAAYASAVSVSYYTMTSANPDVEIPYSGNVITGLLMPTLAANGNPVEVAPGTFQDVNGAGELLWWTPHSIGPNQVVTAGTAFAYPTTVTLPFNIPTNFFPNGTAGANGGANGFVSAVLSATFTTPAGGSVTFTLGSDDDAWIFLNGQLIVDNGGIHAYAPAPTTISGLAPGTNTVEVFFDDRHTVQSGLYFNADVTLTPTVPEASTWAMMLAGFGGLGFAAFRRSRKTSISALA